MMSLLISHVPGADSRLFISFALLANLEKLSSNKNFPQQNNCLRYSFVIIIDSMDHSGSDLPNVPNIRIPYFLKYEYRTENIRTF